jgi:hypothetical protein
MRIATLILALFLMVLVFLFPTGLIGGFMAVMFLVGGIFAIWKPMISVVCFSMAALSAFLIFFFTTWSTKWDDLWYWAAIAVVMAILSFFARQEKRNRKAQGMPVPAPTVPPTTNAAGPSFCPECGHQVEQGAAFCGDCGAVAGK